MNSTAFAYPVPQDAWELVEVSLSDGKESIAGSLEHATCS